MSDDERDIDVESDDGEGDGNDSDSRHQISRHTPTSQYYSQAEKRAHHNALERKRRDHIKDSFSSLRDSVPALNGEKVVHASRAQILKKAAEYIQFMRRKNGSHQQDIEDLKRQNSLLEAQIRKLEREKAVDKLNLEAVDLRDHSESDFSDNEGLLQQHFFKKVKKEP